MNKRNRAWPISWKKKAATTREDQNNKVAPKPNTEDSLIQRIALKDAAAFEELFRLYHSRLTSFVAPIVRDCHFASLEEIVNDTMLVIWRKSSDFRGDSKASTWIFGIAYRTALAERKKLLKKNQHLSDEDPEEVTGPCTQIRQLSFENWLNSAISKLSVEHQTVVRLTFWEGFSYAEIAVAMDCPVNTVKTRMFHAKAGLKKSLPSLLSDGGTESDISAILAMFEN